MASPRRRRTKVDAWTALVKDYLRGRPSLVRVFLLIDARHGSRPPDLAMMAADGRGGRLLPGRADQGRQDQAARSLRVSPRQTAEELAKHAAAYAELLATSSQKGTGIAELRAEIARLAAAHGALADG